MRHRYSIPGGLCCQFTKCQEGSQSQNLRKRARPILWSNRLAPSLGRLTLDPAKCKVISREIGMPIYEYYCPKCNSKFEQLRPMSQANEGVKCPYCNGQAERILTTFSCRTPTGKRGPSGSVIMRSIGGNSRGNRSSANCSSGSS